MSTPRRSRVLWAAAFVAALALVFAFSSSAFAAGPHVVDADAGGCFSLPPTHTTIQAAITAAASGDTIYVCNGTYAENPSISGKNLTIIGESRAGVVINPPNLGAYGIDVQNADVTLKSFTMNGHGTGDTYGLKISGDAIIADVQDVTVDNFYRSGMDFSGLNGLTLKNVTSTNADYGVGVALTDVSNALLENITTSGNAWGGIAIYTRAFYHPASVADNIVLQGTNSIGEANAIYVELDPYNSSTLTFKPATDVSLAGFPFLVTNTNGRNFFSFARDAAGAAQAKAFQEAKFAPGISSITQAGGQMSFWPTGYTVQAAIDAAAAGSTVVVGQGAFTEQLTINKKLTLIGSGAATIIKSPAALTAKSIGGTNRFPVVFVETQDATIKNLVVDGDGKGNANNPFIGIAYWNAGGVIESVEVKNIQDTPFSGAQHGVAIYARVDDNTTRAMTVRNSTVRDFQKNGINFYSGGTISTYIVNASGNKVFGKGVTAVTAQNGIQFWRITPTSTLKGVVEGNTITGIAYDNTASSTKWVATSLLNYYADLDITNNTITGAHMGIYNIDAPARISGNRLQIIRAAAGSTDGYGITATDPPHAVPSPLDGPALGAGAGMASADGADAVLAVTVSNNQVVFVGAPATLAQDLPTFGIEADAGYGADSIALTANGNIVTGFDYGFYFGKCASSCGSGVFTSIEAHNNRIYGNRLYGMYNAAGNPTVNAENNWWGAAAGPVLVTGTSAASPIPAAADKVSDRVDFDPWTTSAVLTVVDAPHVLTTPANTIVVPVRIDPPAANYSSLGFSIDYDQACLEIANPASDVVVLHADLEKAITHDAADSDGELDVALWDAEPNPIPNFVFPAGNFMTIQFTLKPGCNTADPVVVNFSAVPPASCGLQTGFPATDCTTLGAALLVNFNPTDIKLSPQSIDENAASPYTVGTLAAVDAGGGPTYTFSLVAGAGDADNTAFTIAGSDLRLNASPNYEVKSSYSVRVHVDDGRFGSYEKAFTVSVNNLNEPPTDITLTNAVVAENAPPGFVVGNFGVADEDGPASYVFSIEGGSGATLFTIDGTQLKVNAPLAQGTYTLDVKATGPGGLSITETFTITVEDTAILRIDDNLIVRKGSTIAVPVTYVANGNTATNLVFDVTYDAACLDFLGGANAGGGSGTIHVTLNGSPVAGGEVTSLSFYAKNPAEGCAGNRSDSALTLTVVTYQKVVSPVTIPLAISPDSGNVILYKNSPRGDCNSNDVVEAGDFVAIVLEYFDVDTLLDPNSFWLDAPRFGFDGSPRGCDANANATIDTTDVTCTVLVFFGDSACTESGPLSAASVNPVVIAMPGDLAVSAGKAVAVPVALESLGNDVAAVGFILQLDKSKMTFDAADGDGDGIPDAVKLNVPVSFAMRSVVYDAAAGQIKVAIADLSLPLATLDDGALATVTLQGVAAGTTELQFVHASAGNTAGQSLTVIEKIGNGATSTGRAYLSNIQQ